MNKQPEVTEATRAALVDAFCGFYRERPVERITVKEVAAKAGYSRATYYKYFPDNYALLDYVEERLVSEVLGRAQTLPVEDGWGEGFVAAFAEVVEENRAYVAVLSGPTGAAHFSAKLKGQAVPRLMEALGVPAGDTRGRMSLEFYVAGLVAVLGSWLAGEREAEPVELASLVRGILQEGVMAQLPRNGLR